MIKSNKLLHKLISISIGFSGAFFVLEIFARFLPAANIVGIEKPIKCTNPSNVDINCLHRRRGGISFRFTKGKFPPFEVDAIKSTNDIGQFSSTDFNEFINYENNLEKIRILTIGDSQVEALQVDNSETFHDLFNNSAMESVNNDLIENKYISTAIGSSGMAFPNYIQYLNYVLNHTNLDLDLVVFSIQSNDFDESFEKYSNIGRRSGKGQFFFDLEGNIKFKEFTNENLLEKLISISLKNSSLIRYLTYNIGLYENTKNLKIYCLIKNKSSICNQKSFNYAANVVDESPKKNPERFEMGYRATIIFFEKLGQIRSSDFMKRNTILIIDADRGYISGLYPKKGSFFEKQRNFFIQHAKNKGFTVIDLEDVFTEKFKEGLTLNSSVDGHWNENGHKIVFDTLLKEIKDIISK